MKEKASTLFKNVWGRPPDLHPHPTLQMPLTPMTVSQHGGHTEQTQCRISSWWDSCLITFDSLEKTKQFVFFSVMCRRQWSKLHFLTNWIFYWRSCILDACSTWSEEDLVSGIHNSAFCALNRLGAVLVLLDLVTEVNELTFCAKLELRLTHHWKKQKQPQPATCPF